MCSVSVLRLHSFKGIGSLKRGVRDGHVEVTQGQRETAGSEEKTDQSKGKTEELGDERPHA